MGKGKKENQQERAETGRSAKTDLWAKSKGSGATERVRLVALKSLGLKVGALALTVLGLEVVIGRDELGLAVGGVNSRALAEVPTRKWRQEAAVELEVFRIISAGS
jgi:hypothetical protein